MKVNPVVVRHGGERSCFVFLYILAFQNLLVFLYFGIGLRRYGMYIFLFISPVFFFLVFWFCGDLGVCACLIC